MARMIDADELEMFPYSEGAGTEEQIADWIEQAGLSEEDTADRARLLCWKVIEGCINVVKTQPTLTPPNEWVSVYDRLPEPGERVLATDCGFVGEFYINKRGKWQRYNVNCSELLMALDILYWMPLPAPPDSRPPEGEKL